MFELKFQRIDSQNRELNKFFSFWISFKILIHQPTHTHTHTERDRLREEKFSVFSVKHNRKLYIVHNLIIMVNLDNSKVEKYVSNGCSIEKINGWRIFMFSHYI